MTLRLPTARQALIAALTAAALAATALAWARVVHTISNVRPPSSPLAATSVVWADRVFASRPAFTGWLHAHGASYRGWSRNHPFAAARLEHRAPPRQSETATVKATSTVVTAAAAKTRRLASTSSTGGFPLETVLVTLLAVLAAVCIWASTLPAVLRYRYPDLTRWIAAHRDLVAAGGAALVIGVVAGVALN